MNFINPDAFIARRNIEQFDATGKLDIYYLSSLSEDAIADTIKVLDISNEEMRNNFARELYLRAQQTNSPAFSGWQSLNMSRIRAEKILSPKLEELAAYKDYPRQNFDSVEPLSSWD